MIVDDEPDILELLEKSLAIEGFPKYYKDRQWAFCGKLMPDIAARYDYLGRYAARN